jgi:general nucleoside transport system permease protein
VAKKAGPGLLAVLSVAGGFLLGSVILLCTGRNPLHMYRALFMGVTGINLASGGFNPRLLGEFVIQVMPILLTGLAVGFAFRAGHFNIGAEGQLMMGALFAASAALWIHAPAWIHVPLCILAALAGGALWGAIPGILKAFFNIHEVVVTIMLNYAGLYLSNLLILYGIGTLDRVKTAPFPGTAVLKSPFLEGITAGSRLNWAFIPVLLAVAVYWIVIEKTSFGYGLRAAGHNKEAARAAGMPVKRDTVLSLAISGAFAGLAGGVISLGTFGFGRFLPSFEQYGYDGIAVALVGANTAPGIFLSAALFGALKAAGPLMQSAQIPKEIGSIISSSIVLFIAMRLGIERLIELASGRRIRAASDAPGEAGT